MGGVVSKEAKAVSGQVFRNPHGFALTRIRGCFDPRACEGATHNEYDWPPALMGFDPRACEGATARLLSACSHELFRSARL
jgi:hypothetical protein